MKRHLLTLSVVSLSFLSTVGAALPYPILPPLFAGDGQGALVHFLGLPPKLLFGIAVAINPLGLLLGSAVLGPLSDSHGRRRILLLTALACAVGHALTALGLRMESYPLFVLARFGAGLAEGNTPVARALLADRLQGDERVRGLAWLNSATYMGWLAGPLLAGLTVGLGLTVPFWLAAAALLASSVLARLVLPTDDAVPRAQAWWRIARERHALRLLSEPQLRALVVVQLLLTLGLTAFYEFYPLWLVEYAGMAAAGIAWTTAAMCAVMTLSSSLAARMGAVRLGRAAFAALACGVFFACLVPGARTLGIVALVAAGMPISLYNTFIQAFCAERFGHHGQGAIMGLLSTIFCVANVIVALAGSLLALLDTRLVLLAAAAFAVVSAAKLRRWNRAH